MYSSTDIDASSFVGKVDLAFMVITYFSLFLIVALTAIMIWFIYRYNEKRNKKATEIPGSTRLEIIWTVIPILLVLVMFYFGWAGWRPMRTPPADAMEITSISRMWSFSFLYDNGKTSDKLVVPLNQAVKLNLVSVDVIHSLYIPAFRVKEDMVPGLEKWMWFRPTKIGTYDIFCAEYCGLQHSYMYSTVEVLPEEEYLAWYTDTTFVIPGREDMPGGEGFTILQTQGCNACHTSDGSRLVGPSYLGGYGRNRTVIRGNEKTTVMMDDDYIRRSIYDPNYEIVEGYQRGLMQSYKGVLTDADIDKILVYLKALNEIED
jgi:cytochrome c oxidase subunit II